MQLTSSIKRAPKWAYYAAGGVGLGAVAIQVYKRRATDTPAPEDATNDAQTVGTPTTVGGSSAVITPPVIVTPDSPQTDFSGIFGVFGDALNNTVTTIGSLAQGDQALAGRGLDLVGVIAGQSNDLAREAIAQAGQAPAPMAQLPPIVVNLPTATTPGIVPTAPATPPPCPSTHPHRSSKGCYRCVKEGKTYTHIYADGKTPTSRGNSQC